MERGLLLLSHLESCLEQDHNPGTSGISRCERVRPKAEYISPARPREVQQLVLTAGCETREASIEQVLLKSPKKQQLDAANGQNESRNKGAL